MNKNEAALRSVQALLAYASDILENIEATGPVEEANPYTITIHLPNNLDKEQIAKFIKDVDAYTGAWLRAFGNG